MSDKPAILGNRPIFSERVPQVRPDLPPFEDVAKDVRFMMESGHLTKGPHLRAFEQAAAAQLGTRHAVGVSSCTAGLMLTCQALGLKGDVVVPSFTFMATAAALVWAGLRPVFADVLP